MVGKKEMGEEREVLRGDKLFNTSYISIRTHGTNNLELATL
jgi:hypothetical protein